MKETFIVWLLATFFLTDVSIAQTQQQKLPRTGIVFAGGPTAVAARIAAFRAGLNELGYVEGKNIIVEDRYRMEN